MGDIQDDTIPLTKVQTVVTSKANESDQINMPSLEDGKLEPNIQMPDNFGVAVAGPAQNLAGSNAKSSLVNCTSMANIKECSAAHKKEDPAKSDEQQMAPLLSEFIEDGDLDFDDIDPGVLDPVLKCIQGNYMGRFSRLNNCGPDQ